MSRDDTRIHDNHYPEHLLAKNQIASDENVALFHAAEQGRSDEVLACIKRGGKPNFFFRPEDQKNALHIASEKGFVEVVTTLLNNGAVVDCVSVTSQNTALIFAAHRENVVAIRTLIQHGANVNAANGYGNTALHTSCYEGFITNARELINSGANVNQINNKRSTPLHTLCYKTNSSVEFLKLMIQSGADVHARDRKGMTPLLVCCTSGRLDFIQHLIECGADPTARDDRNQDAQAIAIFYGHKQVADYFNHDSPFKRHGGYESKQQDEGVIEGKASHK